MSCCEMALRITLFASLILTCMLSSSAVDEQLHTKTEQECFYVNTTTHRTVGVQGRERYFHGVNVVVKGPPWIPRVDKFDPQWSFCEEDMKLLQEWGLNGIRLGMMWPGAEPEKGQYNQTYFDVSRSIIDNAAKYGIYSLLDMHQDSLSEKFCGEGIPDWAVDTGTGRRFPWPVQLSPFKNNPKTEYPTAEDCAKHSWSSYQASEAASIAYQNLYNNTNGLRDSFAAFWGKVAQEFSTSSNILGYEIINEPWAGDIYHNPLLLLPEVADKENLAKFYDVVNTEIRKHDQCHSVYFESVTWDELGVGFDHVPGGADYSNRSVLSYHFYIPPQVEVDISFAERSKDIKRLKCAGFLSEFSLGSSNTAEVMNKADEYLQSWLGWDYKPYVPITGSGFVYWYENGTMNKEVVKVSSRTYAQAVAGVASQMTYDPSKLTFTLKYTTTKACSSNLTEIYLNEDLHYTGGYTVELKPADASIVRWNSPKKNYIHVTHKLSLPEGTAIQVTINSKTL